VEASAKRGADLVGVGVREADTNVVVPIRDLIRHVRSLDKGVVGADDVTLRGDYETGADGQTEYRPALRDMQFPKPVF
jgi:hypothetical protein